MDEVWLHPSMLEELDDFSTALAVFARKRPDLVAVYPAGEEQLRGLVRKRPDLPDHLRYLMPSTEAVVTCLDKHRCYALASDCDVSLPSWRCTRSLDELERAVNEIGFPCVVKPNTSQATLVGRKCLRLDTTTDLHKALPDWPPEHPDLIVQRFFEGYRHNCNFAAHNGQLLTYAELRVLRTSEADGSGNLVDACTVRADPARRAEIGALLARLDYTGIGCAQYLVDDVNRRFVFLELNPRIASCTAFQSAGFDMTEMALACGGLTSSRLADLDQCREGLRIVWLLGDIQGLVFSHLKRSIALRGLTAGLGASIASWWHADVHVVWSVRDPRPAFAFINQVIRSFARPGTEAQSAVRTRSTPSSDIPPPADGESSPLGCASENSSSAEATSGPRAR
ncbi:MAG: hypothetical protein V7746_00835 [Halioglobus sp.]